MNGQISLFDFMAQEDLFNITYDRTGQAYTAPSWMSKERCENCQRWARYQTEEQPPAGCGVKGWCLEHSQKTDRVGYCQKFERKMFDEI